MDLRDFPFDRQLIRIRFQSSFYGDDGCHFVDYTDPEMIEVFSEKIRLTEWKLTRLAEVRALTDYNDEDKRDMSVIEVDLYFKRQTGYYLKNIIGLLFILSVISWAMYIVPPYVINDRLQVLSFSIGPRVAIPDVSSYFAIRSRSRSFWLRWRSTL